MRDDKDRRKDETPLEKSERQRIDEGHERKIEYTREDPQIIRDELPPVYPVDDEGE